MPHNNNKIKEELFGTVKKAPANGGHQPDLEKIKNVLGAGAVIGCFCTGCGYTQGFSKQGARDIAKETGIELPESLENNFFTVEQCLICGDTFSKLEYTNLATETKTS